MNVSCYFCGELVDPLARDTYRRVTGWERKALGESRKGGSDIVLRAAVEEFAHPGCVVLVQNGLLPAQALLL